MGLFNAFKRNLKLMRIMKRLGGGKAGDRGSLESHIDRVLSGRKSDYELAREELFDLVLSDSDLGIIVVRYDLTRDELSNIYDMLILFGAGQWVRGGYVAAAALATLPTLDYILFSLRNNTQYEPRELGMVIASDLIEYYQSGRMGPVKRTAQ